MINPNGLFMIEPKLPPSDNPTIDAYTKIMAAILINTEHRSRYKGFHACSCGAMSDNIDHYIRGLQTNSLAVHYLAYHRPEVPEDDINRMMNVCGFDYGAVTPPAWMLCRPGGG